MLDRGKGGKRWWFDDVVRSERISMRSRDTHQKEFPSPWGVMLCFGFSSTLDAVLGNQISIVMHLS